MKYTDGFPIEFSWPVLPSSVAGNDFRVVLNTGQVITPLAASITPNFEYNERSTVVILGYFGNRIAPGQPGAIYPVKLEVAHSRTPLKLVGPGGCRGLGGGAYLRRRQHADDRLQSRVGAEAGRGQAERDVHRRRVGAQALLGCAPQ